MVKKAPKVVVRPNRRVSGHLRKPGRLAMSAAEFSVSFTQQLKLNNETLAKRLSNEKDLNRQLSDELRMQRLKNTEQLMQMNSFDTRNKERAVQMETYIVGSLRQVKDMANNLIAMQAEVNSWKANDNSYRRVPSDLSSERVSGSAQTQFVGPMVNGHTIKQPRISLFRINSHAQGGACVPAAPVPAGPAGASPGRLQDLVTAGAPGSLDPQPTTLPVASTDVNCAPESMQTFYARVLSEDPMEGPSSGRSRRHAAQPPRALFSSSSSSDTDDDNDNNMMGSSEGNRTSYSPINMDITVPRRLSAIVQELSPMETPHLLEQPKNIHCDKNVPDSDKNNTTPKISSSNIEILSPIESVFRGFNEAMTGAQDRSVKELHSPPWNGLSEGKKAKMSIAPFIEDEPLNVFPRGSGYVGSRSEEFPEMPVNPSACPPKIKPDFSPGSEILLEMPVNSGVRLPQGKSQKVDNKHKKGLAERCGGGPGSASSCSSEPAECKSTSSRLTKRKPKLDPEWRPGSSETIRDAVLAERKQLIRRRVFQPGQYKDLDSSDIRPPPSGNLDPSTPRVVVDRLDPVAIEEATAHSISRAHMKKIFGTPEEVVKEESKRGRSLRSVPQTSYREPSLNTKLRRS